MKKSILLSLIALLSGHTLPAQTFQQISTNVNFNNTYGLIIMADLDNDGYPEVVQSGMSAFSIFKNNNGVFIDPNDYPDFHYNNHIFSIDAGDINKDGYIDILQGGQNAYGPNVPQLLLNNTSGFSSIEGKILDTQSGSLFLGDFEGDGDLDIVSSGSDGILLNTNGHWNWGPWFPKNGTWYANWCNLDTDSELEIIQAHGGSNYFVGNYILESHFPSMSISSTLTVPQLCYGR